MRRLIICLLMFAGAAQAGLPENDQRPLLRPFAALPKIIQTAHKPKLRPIELAGLFGKRKNRLKQRGNSVCGKRDIIGAPVAKIKKGSCGISQPVRITSVAGVTLSNAATLNCDTALALREWLEKSAKPALKRKNGGLVSMRVAASYACRTRNSRAGAKLSEHAKGNAIDISSFTLKQGTTLSVLRDWRGPNSAVMRTLHKKACGPFGTVLGPNADRYHQDHFHFDVAKHRSGSYCR